MTDYENDLVILGGGSGGYAAALRAAGLGLTVTLVEADELGGTCLHRGCIPTKALLHAGEVAETVRTAGKLGIGAEFTGIDVAAVQKYKNAIVSRLHRGLAGLVGVNGITVVKGYGTLVDGHTVMVDGDAVRGEHIVLATGAAPVVPQAFALSSTVLTSDQALDLDRIPDSAIILGGGVIGVEFASMWSSMGAEVTIVEAADRLVPAEDPELAARLQRAFKRRKIVMRTGTMMTGVTSSDAGVEVALDDDSTIAADVLLIAVGRAPVSGSLVESGIEIDSAGFVVTDDRLRTSIDSVFAVGDLVRGPQLAHRGFAHGVFVAEEIAGTNPTPVDDDGVPRVTYSQPEIASVGLSEAAATVEYGGDVRTVTYDLAGNGRSQILAASGLVKLVLAPDDRVLGVHLVGEHVGELIGEAQLLTQLGVPATDAARLVHAHPTQGEALGEALLMAVGAPLHAHS
ncbi:dihydrolipoyl dehydrogenase [Gordonia spumicola]|uniref:Dihydrolipoyl dehydrogenase n=1 Tax=Gordonia spumicola TaxID=589161 RepID=A0A7I9V3M7_9ACTN|nr:dihydrolipoyl dehydrogenase [Gordonia spumicola]GED99826.1 dihydrolipoyl dehydrogenase [Gordonia spumicola]